MVSGLHLALSLPSFILLFILRLSRFHFKTVSRRGFWAVRLFPLSRSLHPVCSFSFWSVHPWPSILSSNPPEDGQGEWREEEKTTSRFHCTKRCKNTFNEWNPESTSASSFHKTNDSNYSKFSKHHIKQTASMISWEPSTFTWYNNDPTIKCCWRTKWIWLMRCFVQLYYLLLLICERWNLLSVLCQAGKLIAVTPNWSTWQPDENRISKKYYCCKQMKFNDMLFQ